MQGDPGWRKNLALVAILWSDLHRLTCLPWMVGPEQASPFEVFNCQLINWLSFLVGSIGIDHHPQCKQWQAMRRSILCNGKQCKVKIVIVNNVKRGNAR